MHSMTYSRVNVNHKCYGHKGSEFISKHLKDFLKKEGIKLYHTENEEKSSVVERWNKTMKNRMWKMFTVNNNTVYWDKIDKLVNAGADLGGGCRGCAPPPP